MTQYVLSLRAENFRKWDLEYFKFYNDADTKDGIVKLPYKMISVKGRNGAAKSSIKEALIFALTGRDSSGGTKPLHLIKNGSESMRVTLDMSTVSITRSMTRKGNSTLKVSQGSGSTTSVTAKEFRDLLGYDEDAALCALLPGHFMSLPQDSRKKLILKHAQSLSKTELLRRFGGLDDNFFGWLRLRYGREDSNIPSLQKVSAERLKFRRELLVPAQAEVQRLKLILSEVLYEPKPIENYKELEDLYRKDCQLRAEYKEALKNYTRSKSLAESFAAFAESTKRKAESLTEELVNITFLPVIDVDWGEYENLKATLIPYPEKPTSIRLTESDRCSSCGQLIGLDHRRLMAESVKNEMAAYDKAVEGVTSHNAPILDKMSAMHKELMRAEDLKKAAIKANEFSKIKQEEFTKALESLPVAVPPVEVVQPPAPPCITLTDEDFRKLSMDLELYHKSLGAYEAKKAAQDDASSKLDDAVRTEVRLLDTYSKLESLEYALSQLHTIELVARKQMLNLSYPGLSILEGDGFQLALDGVPYECLSTGEKAKVDLYLCSKFHAEVGEDKTCKLPMTIFWDNADLVDHDYIFAPPGCQVFYALVREQDLTVDGCLTTSSEGTQIQEPPF